MKNTVRICLCLVFVGISVFATSKTLPKGVFKLDVSNMRYSVDALGANPSGDKETWERVSLKDGKMKHIYLLSFLKNHPQLPVTGLNLETKLVNSWEKAVLKADLAYGITDKITVFSNISYERAELDYTDEYVQQSSMIDTSGLGELLKYKRVPDKAEADNLNDTFVGLKYNFGPVAAAYKGTFGFLKTGHDSTEKKYEDGVQELETSRGYDQHHFYLFKDLLVFNQSLELTGGYIVLGEMTQIFLDNSSIKFNPGNIFVGKLNVPMNFHKQMSLHGSLTSMFHFKDKYKGGNSKFSNITPVSEGYSSWTTVPKSDGFVHMADFEVRYQPTIFLRIFAKTTVVLSNKISGQLYNFPGRLEPGPMLTFGVTLFAKK